MINFISINRKICIQIISTEYKSEHLRFFCMLLRPWFKLYLDFFNLNQKVGLSTINSFHDRSIRSIFKKINENKFNVTSNIFDTIFSCQKCNVNLVWKYFHYDIWRKKKSFVEEKIPLFTNKVNVPV